MEEFVSGVIDQRVESMGYGNVSYGGDSALYVEFYLRAVELKFRSEAEGRPIFEEQEFVRIHVPGGKTVIDRKASDRDKARFPFQYKRFKANEQTQIVGTPLEQWPQLSLEQVATYKALNIFSVEQLAAIPDNVLDKMGMGAREFRAKAKAFLELAKDTSQAQKFAAENERLKGELEALKAEVAALASKERQGGGEVGSSDTMEKLRRK